MLDEYEGETLKDKLKAVIKDMEESANFYADATYNWLTNYQSQYKDWSLAQNQDQSKLISAAFVEALDRKINSSNLSPEAMSLVKRLGYDVDRSDSNSKTLKLLFTPPMSAWGELPSGYRPTSDSFYLAAAIGYLRKASETPGVRTPKRVAEYHLRNEGLLIKNKDPNFPIGKMYIPYSINGVDNSLSPAVDVTPYFNAIDKIKQFGSENIFPSNINPEKVSLRISASKKDFDKLYKTLRPGTKKNTSRILGTNSYAGSTPEQSASKNIKDRNTIIAINHEVAQAWKADFGTNSIEETVLHEFGHLVHNTISTDWGAPGLVNSQESSRAYAKAKQKFITEYGKKSYREHFAESFSNYLATGDATPEFKDFLRETVKITPFNRRDYRPEVFEDFEEKYTSWMENADLDGWKIKMESVQLFDNDLSPAEIIRREKESRYSTSMKFKGDVYRPDGEKAGRFERTITRGMDGELTVYHDYFEIYERFQGEGFGTKFSHASEKFYEENGISEITLTAALKNGPYAWALMGYDYLYPQQRRIAIESVKEYQNYLNFYVKNKAKIDKIYQDLEVSDSSSALRNDLSITTNLRDIITGQSPTLEGNYVMSTISRFKTFMLESILNKWELDDELVQEFDSLKDAMDSETLTPEMVATLGRFKKSKEKYVNKFGPGVRVQSLGRYIIMLNENRYTGVKKLNPKNKPKKAQTSSESPKPEENNEDLMTGLRRLLNEGQRLEQEEAQIRPALWPEEEVEDMDLKEIVDDEESKEESYQSKDTKDSMAKVLGKLQDAFKDGFKNRPWRKPYKEGEQFIGAEMGTPRNPASKHVYRGTNAFVLSIIGNMYGFKDKRWVTYNQAQDLGGQIPKGVKSPAFILVPFTKPIYKDKNGNPYLDAEGKPAPRSYVFFGTKAVWNVEQVEGLSLDDDTITTANFSPLDAQNFVLERYAKNMEAKGLQAPKINYTYVGQYGNHAMGSSSPNWNPASDEITLPTEAQFSSPEEWFETLMHELIHSTGHVDRLDRTEITKNYGSNPAARGLEELIAEMGAATLGEMFGVNYDFDNTTAYVESWQKAISELDLSSLQKASTLAQLAVDYLLGIGLGDWSPVDGYSVGGSKSEKPEAKDE